MSNNYNSRLKPAEVLWHKNKALLIRQREDFKDILNKQIELNYNLHEEISDKTLLKS